MRSDFANATGSHLFSGALIGSLVGFPSGDALLGLIVGSVTTAFSYLADRVRPVAQKLETKKNNKNLINQSLPSVG